MGQHTGSDGTGQRKGAHVDGDVRHRLDVIRQIDPPAVSRLGGGVKAEREEGSKVPDRCIEGGGEGRAREMKK